MVCFGVLEQGYIANHHFILRSHCAPLDAKGTTRQRQERRTAVPHDAHQTVAVNAAPTDTDTATSCFFGVSILTCVRTFGAWGSIQGSVLQRPRHGMAQPSYALLGTGVR
jgi:hypothetical protein